MKPAAIRRRTAFRSSRPWILGALLLSTFPTTQSLAQVVNVVPLIGTNAACEGGGEDVARSDECPDAKLDVELRGALSWQTGNVKFLSANASTLIRQRVGRRTFILRNTNQFARGAGDPFLNRHITHLRHQVRLWTTPITWETYAQATFDRIWRLKLRMLIGGGPRWDVLRRDAVQLAVAASYMYEHQRLSRQEDVGDSGRVENNHRLSTYLTAAFDTGGLFRMVQTVYYQPRFDAWTDDFRVFSQTDLVVRASEQVALSLTFVVMYDSNPAETVLTTDTSLTSSIGYTF